MRGITTLGIEKETEAEILSISDKFGRLDIDNDENPRRNFNHIGILDIFNYCLSEQEAAELLSSFNDHNLRYEDNFKLFFKELLQREQEKSVYVNIGTPIPYYREFKEMKPSEFWQS
jgi:hypothetical protein